MPAWFSNFESVFFQSYYVLETIFMSNLLHNWGLQQWEVLRVWIRLLCFWNGICLIWLRWWNFWSFLTKLVAKTLQTLSSVLDNQLIWVYSCINEFATKYIKQIGVLRDTARAPQPPTNQPKGHHMSQQGLYVLKKAYFGAKMAFFGPNILIILGGSKSSGTYQKTT